MRNFQQGTIAIRAASEAVGASRWLPGSRSSTIAMMHRIWMIFIKQLRVVIVDD